MELLMVVVVVVVAAVVVVVGVAVVAAVVEGSAVVVTVVVVVVVVGVVVLTQTEEMEAKNLIEQAQLQSEMSTKVSQANIIHVVSYVTRTSNPKWYITGIYEWPNRDCWVLFMKELWK